MEKQSGEFREASLMGTPIRDLKLRIEGTALEKTLLDFQGELHACGILKVVPRFYLSTEWGVAFGTVAIAIPFYLAHPKLKSVQRRRAGLIEGLDAADVLRYIRHEMGHVVNYAYKLYERQDWVQNFGSITQPYLEDYRPEPFSQRYVTHLPGWYAQKHPDEDWAETFAVWMAGDWQRIYARLPIALAKLEFCDSVVKQVAGIDPIVTACDPDEDVGQLTISVDQYYGSQPAVEDAVPPGLDGALRAVFERLPGEPCKKPAAELIRSLEYPLLDSIYRWTGHFPERTRPLIHHLANRAEALGLCYGPESESQAVVAFTALVATLAASYVYRGTYVP
jgi:hypothetical protein